MNVSIDAAGRVVVPKRMRDELGLTPGTLMEIDVVDGHIELSGPHRSPVVLAGPHGPSFAATGAAIDDEGVRSAVESARERR